ncbi:FMN-binding protein [Amnibacterium sp.]|uniref:FMN-binding protein n=1 Tax=Amnibacterium sp. TaxID=1872496 RepID=UPI00262E5D49|nr:FMN-binding protein [Amnibacterium sp.]MCU1475261.1 FMN-binding protein [Amnibacterium sp.]
MRPTALATAVSGAGLLAVGLSGCASAADAGTIASGAAPASAPVSSSSVPSGTTFKDGTYSDLGRYTSPGGASAVAVTLTLKQGVVTALEVVPKAENPTASGYESRFASGVGGTVIGKPITALNVTVVSGSSLTSQGFDAAIAAIEAKAAA